jgi:hypothetical protein
MKLDKFIISDEIMQMIDKKLDFKDFGEYLYSLEHNNVIDPYKTKVF